MAILKNSCLTEIQKQKWMKVMTNDFMSSEENDDDNTIIRPLEWRSTYVNEMFTRIGSFSQNKKSPQAKRQTKTRVYGQPSSRSCPMDSPGWAVKS